MKPVRVVGLTGGIAAGKSTVGQMFKELGASVLDADLLAREAVLPGTPGLLEISARFPGVLLADGTLNRPALAGRIFGHPEDRDALNAILHPRIQALARQRTQALADAGVPLVLYDAALLIENRLHERMDGVILVAVPPEVQRARLMARDGLSGEEANARLASQLPLEEKRRHATWVVDNSGGLAQTRAQVQTIWEALQALP